jgi:hypothetical protein
MADNKNVTIKRAEQPQEGIIIQNITIRPVQRQIQDIQKWRNALIYAESIAGNRVPLYDLYEEIMLDAFLASLIEKRSMGVLKNKVMFVDKEGKEVEKVMELVKTKAFRQLRKEIFSAKIWGIRVIETIQENKIFRTYAVPPKHVRPKEGKIVFEQYGNDGIFYKKPPNNKYIMEVGTVDDLGLIFKAAPYVIYKRGGFGDWSQFCEIFGMPFRKATWDGYNDTTRKQLETMLEQAGSASYAILPEGTNMEFITTNHSGTGGDVYNKLREACNEELSVLILGQTETTTASSSSGYAQAQTHADVQNDIAKIDQEDELSILNELVKPILANLGYPVDAGEFIYHVEHEKLTATQKLEVFVRMKTVLELPLNDDQVYKEMGVEKPEDYEAQKEEMKKSKGIEQQQKFKQKQEKKQGFDKEDENDDEEPVDEEKLYAKFSNWLLSFFDKAPKVKK